MNKLHLPCPFDTDFPVPDMLRQLFTEVERRRADIDDTEESELSSELLCSQIAVQCQYSHEVSLLARLSSIL